MLSRTFLPQNDSFMLDVALGANRDDVIRARRSVVMTRHRTARNLVRRPPAFIDLTTCYESEEQAAFFADALRCTLWLLADRHGGEILVDGEHVIYDELVDYVSVEVVQAATVSGSHPPAGASGSRPDPERFAAEIARELRERHAIPARTIYSGPHRTAAVTAGPTLLRRRRRWSVLLTSATGPIVLVRAGHLTRGLGHLGSQTPEDVAARTAAALAVSLD